MFINIHIIQNHSSSNMNRDDLGAPKTCYFGGVLRSRISSQCLKRSIRMNSEFQNLLGGIRTRRLAELISKEVDGDSKKYQEDIKKILEKCGIKSGDSDKKKKTTAKETDDDEGNDDQEQDVAGKKDSKMLVYTTREGIREMAEQFKKELKVTEGKIEEKFAEIISSYTVVPDMALSGRMLEPSGAGDIWKKNPTTVEAALQVAHAISTHETHPEVDYFVAADDIPGDDAGAGYLDEAMFNSSCFYKYFSIDWKQLLKNLNGNKKLAAHTVGAYIRGAVSAYPTGKQNSFAAHNPPDGVLIEINSSPVSYANAFADPVSRKTGRGIVEQSIAQLAQYASDIQAGFGKPDASLWFSPNLRYKPNNSDSLDIILNKSLDELTVATIDKLKLGITWMEAKEEVLNENNVLNMKYLEKLVNHEPNK